MPMKKRVERHEERGQTEKGNDEAERAGDRVAIDDDRRTEAEHEQREDPKENRRHHATQLAVVILNEVKDRTFGVGCAPPLNVVRSSLRSDDGVHFFSFHFNTTPCMTPPISSSFSLSCTISARVKPVMA